MSWANEIFNQLTLEQKVGQMLIARCSFEKPTMEMLRKGLLGGIGSSFIVGVCDVNYKKIVDFTNRILKESMIQPFFYTDCENGLAHMFPIGVEMPNNMSVAATYDLNLSYKMGRAIANQAKTMGYDIIAGPVIDVNSNPNNPIIGTRAFADTTEMVVEFGKAYVDGVQDEYVVACGKHFPGHGDTSEDSHISIPVVDKCLKTLNRKEFYPFRLMVEHGIKGIMTSHIYFPSLQGGEKLPVTFSEKAIKKLLLQSWNFNGLVITDSLSMHAITNNYSIEEAAVLSMKAGNDLILQDMDSDPYITHTAMVKAVKDGVITEEDLDHRVMKILKAKEWCKIDRDRTITEKTIERLNNNKFHAMLSQEIADKSITVLENRHLPLSPNEDILIISTKNDEGVERVKELGTLITHKTMVLYELIKEYNENTAITTISEDPTEEEISRMLDLSKRFKHVIISNYIRIRSYKKGSGTIPESQVNFIKRLSGQCKSVTNLIFGNPYVITKLPKTANVILAYSDCNQCIRASVDVLFGTKKAVGRLPIKLSRKYDREYGMR